MIFIRRLTLLDRGEDKDQFVEKAKVQWGIQDSLAVRVTGGEGQVLGTTFPQKVKTLDQSLDLYLDWIDGEDKTSVTEAAIDCSACLNSGDVCAFEVLSLSGVMYSTGVVDVSFGAEKYRHGALLLTPLACPVGSETIYGCLDYSVVDSGFYRENVEGGSETLPPPLPSLENLCDKGYVSGCVSFSAKSLFYPSPFMCGDGTYVVSNVLTVENNSDSKVEVEFLFSGGGGDIRVNPSSVSLSQKGQQAAVAFTHDVFEKYTKDVKVYAIIQQDGENQIPFSLTSNNNFPSPEDGLFLLWVNMNEISNVSLDENRTKEIKKILPVFSLSSKN